MITRHGKERSWVFEKVTLGIVCKSPYIIEYRFNLGKFQKIL
jgi:hypothetical protein